MTILDEFGIYQQRMALSETLILKQVNLVPNQRFQPGKQEIILQLHLKYGTSSLTARIIFGSRTKDRMQYGDIPILVLSIIITIARHQNHYFICTRYLEPQKHLGQYI